MNRDKYLTEAMGLKWRERLPYDLFNINFSTWQGFGTLLNSDITQNNFIEISILPTHPSKVILFPFVGERIILRFTDTNEIPDKFADALYKFLKERE